MTTDPFRDAFERMAPRPVDPSTARAELGALTPGFQKARRFHRIRIGAATAVCALGLAAGGPAVLAAVGSDGGSQPLDFASQGESDPDIAGAAEAESDSVDGDESPDAEEPDAPDHLDSGDDSDEAGDDPSLEAVGEGDSTSPDESSSSPSSPSSSSSSDDGSGGGADDVVAVDTAATTQPSAGGSVIYKVVDGALVLISYPAADGFTPEVVTELANEIEVRFVGGSIEWEVEIELEHGVPVTNSHLSGSDSSGSGSSDEPDEPDESDEPDEPDTEEG